MFAFHYAGASRWIYRLSTMAGEMLADARTGKNGQHALVGMLRQSVFGRLAGYERCERRSPDPPQSFTQFITTVFDTPQGWKLIGFGTGIGFVFAVLALSLSAVSFPMLLDRPIDAEAIDVEIEHPVVAPTIDVPIAIQTSIKAVLVNQFTMALWGLIVAGSLAIVGLCRSRGCGARSRAFDLASLPQGRGTGWEVIQGAKAPIKKREPYKMRSA
jgi:hypothetical protein